MSILRHRFVTWLPFLPLVGGGCHEPASNVFVLRVLDADTGQPVEGICVSANANNFPLELSFIYFRQGATDSDGLVTVVTVGYARPGNESPQETLKLRLTEGTELQESIEFIAEAGVVFAGERFTIEVVSADVQPVGLGFLGRGCD